MVLPPTRDHHRSIYHPVKGSLWLSYKKAVQSQHSTRRGSFPSLLQDLHKQSRGKDWVAGTSMGTGSPGLGAEIMGVEQDREAIK